MDLRVCPIAAIVAITIASSALPARAEETPDGPLALRGGIVVLTAKGVLPAQGNAPVSQQGTGFFSSKAAYIVTAYHLLKDLGQVDPDSVSYEVRMDPLSQDIIPASAIFSNPAADILVLFVPIGDRNVKVLQPAKNALDKIVPGKTAIYTGGFPAGYGYSVDTGIIKSKQGTLSPPLELWSTSITFKGGQSGSPIVLQDNTVIAIAKGVDEQATSIGLVSPIRYVPDNYWDTGFSAASPQPSGPTTRDASDLTRLTVQAATNSSAPIAVVTNFSLRNEHCSPPTDQAYRISASPNSRIDAKSIQISLLSVQGEVSFSVISPDENGFTVKAHMANVGSCPSSQGGTSPLDTAAVFVARAKYNEFSTGIASRLATIADVTGAQNISVPLPASLNKLVFKLRDASGAVQTFVPTAQELSKQDGKQFLDVAKVVSRLSAGG